MSQSGQILYLGGSNTKASGGGSLSTRFQKLAQVRGGGITIVNQPTALESRPGRSLGLGQGTGSRPTGKGQRITTGGVATGGRGGRSKGSGDVQGSAAGGLHTAAGLARAMQERGGGVSDEFLFAPAAFVAGSGGPSVRGGRNARGGGTLRGAGGARQQQQQGPKSRAANHKALALGQRPGRKQAAKVSQTQEQQQQQQQQGRGRNGRGANNAAAQAQTPGKKGKGAQTSKSNGPAGKQNKKGKVNADSLDSELSEYMMKDTQTAASALDNDLDSYMAEKPMETNW